MLVILSQNGLQGHGLSGGTPLGFVFAITACLLFVVFAFRNQAKKFRKQIVELSGQNLKEATTVKDSQDVVTLTGSRNPSMDHWGKGLSSSR